MEKYDLIVVGAGHAGIEAAYAASRMGISVLLLTLSLDTIGKLSCNPAVGGVSKGGLVKEVDALGGLIGRLADSTAVSYRRLNKSKGKAVWATRAQVDMFLYPQHARKTLENTGNIEILEAKTDEILLKNKKVLGVRTNFGEIFYGKTVIICAGTFLNSTLHIGMDSFPGGRLYELSSNELFKSIERIGLRTKFFKTGTCARLDKRAIDFSQMVEQKPEYEVEPFSSRFTVTPRNQLSCYITHTNKKTHKIIMENLDRSPLYRGKIKARGVRYCPSLEDKVVKFSHKESHQVFIEPEGWETPEVYPNGISTSLPYDVQEDFIRTIAGLENAVILRPGYGIEHGLIDPTQLYPTLETKLVNGLFFAGQVNGTTGYEEAAAQGIIAGINAALKVKKQKPFILRRDEALIAVLIDDLTSKGTDEPYRMFTSRAEFRLLLRESNADIRLTPLAYRLGLVEKQEYIRVKEKKALVGEYLQKMRSTRIVFESIEKKTSLFELLKRPHIHFDALIPYLAKNKLNSVSARELEIEVKYQGFLKREAAQAQELKNMDRVKIPPTIKFEKIPSLSREVVEKLNALQPKTLGEALRISGITPAAVIALYTRITSLQKRKKKRARSS